jgi:tetratricopeptide (TPR) repeat protein
MRAGRQDPVAILTDFAVSLRGDGMVQAARALVDDAIKRFPDEAWPLFAGATACLRAGDNRGAVVLAQSLIAGFPALSDGYRLAALGLIRQGARAEATALLAGLGERDAHAEWRLSVALELAEHGQDHAAMLTAAQALVTYAPQNAGGHIALAKALQQLGHSAESVSIIQGALVAFPDHHGVWQAAANLAEARSDIAGALTAWADVRARFPNESAGYAGAVRTLKNANRMDEAPAILAEGLQRLPNDRELLTIAARTAEGAQDMEGASAYWQRLVQLAPGNPRYAVAAALSLVGAPVGRRKRWPEVFARLDEVLARFPNFAPAYAAKLDCLRRAKRLDEAAAHAAAWIKKFPDSNDIALHAAAIAAERGDAETALHSVSGVRTQSTPDPMIEAAYIKALSGVGRHDEADAACDAALARFPGNRKLLSEHARLATRRGDWLTAQARLVEAQRQWPADSAIAKQLLHARIQLAGQADAAPDPVPAGVEATLFSRFESLGGSFLGCEFGTVQRSFGAESLGLLRWTRVTAEDLTKAMLAEFEGVGSEENTILKTVRNSNNVEEYVTSDRLYGLKSNTFTRVEDAPFEKMFAQTCRRLRFLRGRMLEDLHLAEKIFVFKAFHPLVDGTIRKLHAAMRRYGDVALLCVLKADAANPKGTVRSLAPGLYVGYVGFFMKDADRNPGADREGWLAVCADAEARFRLDRNAPRVDVAA